MKQTAVEWLEEQMRTWGNLPVWMRDDIVKQAKEMEKEQMWNYIKVNYVNGENSLAFHKEEFEQYYTETFKSE